ncbi:phosphatidylinositol-3,5-bisphosphate 5-phosphatase [Boothiomyces sp. JEL0866]|nr:phosphatidylinositol-3,5-bisphosphate 5-phosphatase [Boothiomyces sp. JEL0866]
MTDVQPGSINLHELPLPQLQAVRQQIEEELQVLTNSFAKLKQAQSKFSESIESLKSVTPGNQGRELLVPLTNSLYVPGILDDSTTVIVDVGTGYFVEKNIEDAADYYQRKVDFVKGNLAKLEETLILKDFTCYETKTRYYIIGSNTSKDAYRIAKLDKTSPNEVSFVDDQITYSLTEMQDLLAMISNGNKSTGGLKKTLDFCGIFGFVQFQDGYYLLLITKKSPVALIGGHYIYHVDDTAMIPIMDKPKSAIETRYCTIFSQVFNSKNFYFSYTYDITNSLQNNLTGCKINDMFVWNSYLTEGFDLGIWTIPVIHGFVDQSKISVYGHNVVTNLPKGYVANDVETEQIVNDESTTMFYAPNNSENPKPCYTSFLQHRGSIPLFWSQENSSMAAKPSIQVDYIDPFYTATAKHFDDLYKRYGSPIIILNLVKAKEKTKRESILLEHFTTAVEYLNQSLPEGNKMKYIAWDMASKTGDLKVHPDERLRFQRGILRTNCIDCLDRTNAAQFVVGKCALGHQLYALGIIAEPTVPFDSDAINIFNAMYHDHGDTIALQYGGSHLVNTMETYRKISAWTSHSRDVIESIRRYYSNSFADAEKQDAMNLFLGNYQVQKEAVDLWDLPTDYYLHNAHPRNLPPVKSYIDWYTPKYLNNEIPRLLSISEDNQFNNFVEYYNPASLTALDNLFSYRMISTPANVSSFTAKPNSASAKSLVIYNLNIGGVKKWLNPSTKPTTPKKNDSISSTKTLSTPTNTLFTTATLVNKLLSPSVTIGEEKEYSRPRHILTQTTADVNEADNIKEHPDFDSFTQYIKKPLAQNEGEVKDEKLYQEYVHVSGNTESYIGIGARSNDISRFEGYHHWFETGVYVQRNKRASKY